jgi:hypothetical protein
MIRVACLITIGVLNCGGSSGQCTPFNGLGLYLPPDPQCQTNTDGHYSNCIALTDLHFLLTGTARVAGTPYP